MKTIHGGLLLASFFGGALPSAACPNLQGTYQIAESQAFLYLQKQQDEDYSALVKGEDGALSLLPVISIAEKDRMEQNIPECALVIQRLGMFMPSAKDQSYSVSAQSQAYLSTKNPGTDYVILIMAGFQSDVVGVNKTTTTLPADALQAFSQP